MVTHAEYMKNWRHTPGGKESLDRQKRRARARFRALNILANRYPTEYEALLENELKRVDAEAREIDH